MSGGIRAYILAYDIREPRRLQQVHKFMVGEGLAVQYSVFVGAWDQADLRRVEIGIRTWIEWEADDIRVYPIPDQCNSVLLGRTDSCDGIDLAPTGLDLFRKMGQGAASVILRRQEAEREEWASTQRQRL